MLSDLEYEQKKLEGQLKEQAKQEQARYRTVFDTPQGRKVLADILEMGAVFTTTFDQDVHRSTHLEGRRSLALDIVNKVVEADVRILTKTLEEGANNGNR